MDNKTLLNKYISKDDIYLFNIGEAQNAWILFGCHYIPEEKLHRFVLWAPNAAEISIVGNFNNWDISATPMSRTDGGVWYAFVEGIKKGDYYKYAVKDSHGKITMKSDPFAFWSETNMNTASRVWESSHKWTDDKYVQARYTKDIQNSPISIYEMHLGSWKDYPEDTESIYRAVADDLADYCKKMGYTHVELLPITEYPYPGSWGYQVTGYYCPTSRYGCPDDFKYFVNKLHKAGIGIIIDWVPAHFPKDEHGLAMFDGTAQFECKEKRMAEHPEWGTLIFDYSSPEVQSFLISSACLFFEEYHIDGIRVDAVSSMLYLNYGRKEGQYTKNKEGGNINLDAVDFLRKLNSTILSRYAGAMTIAEESTAYPLVSYPPSVGGLGFTFKWDMGFMHDTLDYMSMDSYFRSGNHNKLTFSMMYAFSENFILAYSHDEVVHGKKSMLDKMWGDYNQKFASLKALYGFQFAHPGKKLTFMGSDFGQFIEWNFSQGLDWKLLDYPSHKQMHDYFQELNKLYLSSKALYECDHSWDGFKWLNVDDNQRSSVAFMRTGTSEGKGKYIICACNFTPVNYDEFRIALPFKGKLKEILSSDDEKFGGSGIHNDVNIKINDYGFMDMNYSAPIKLPALSAVFFSYEPVVSRRKKDET